MKQDMCRVRDHSIALRQERVRLAEHSFEALSPLWFGANEIRDHQARIWPTNSIP